MCVCVCQPWSYHAWRHSWHDTIASPRREIRYVGVWVIFMHEDAAHAQCASRCIEYYYLLRWPAVTDGGEMPLADIDTSDTHLRPIHASHLSLTPHLSNLRVRDDTQSLGEGHSLPRGNFIRLFTCTGNWSFFFISRCNILCVNLNKKWRQRERKGKQREGRENSSNIKYRAD